ncbi:MAG TPA: hypothetical protein VM576_00850 [Xanthomonadaceae bacterium]|nr:hypothetical protein [Xanthomonadaceae bacterium]
MIRLCSLLFAALLSAGACAPAAARPLVDLSVVDRDDGRPLPAWPHRGDHWIAGTPGHRYAVRLANTTGERVLVVLSVDGVNAVSGETAGFDQAGYVLGPWETAEIDGWRKSLDDVARFVFTDLGDAYAARTGRPDNVGVIGIAVFRERRPEPVAMAPAPQRALAEADAAGAAKARQQLGTGHGERAWAPVSRTAFERATRTPEQVTRLRYDDASRLLAMGIGPYRRWRYPRPQEPDAFPHAFVPDPPR